MHKPHKPWNTPLSILLYVALNVPLLLTGHFGKKSLRLGDRPAAVIVGFVFLTYSLVYFLFRTHGFSGESLWQDYFSLYKPDLNGNLKANIAAILFWFGWAFNSCTLLLYYQREHSPLVQPEAHIQKMGVHPSSAETLGSSRIFKKK